MSAPSIAELFELGRNELFARHGAQLTADHHRALTAISLCSPRAPHRRSRARRHRSCTGCGNVERRMRSCGHRSCPACQHAQAEQWLERQHAKLLPVPYFMVTFTIPGQLRQLAFNHQRAFFGAMFTAASETLATFARNDTTLRGQSGACIVLHTRSRRLEYHPHLHAIVPGGAIDTERRQWRKVKTKYLFNSRKLATVFRAKLLDALNRAGLSWPTAPVAPAKWIVHCKRVGDGLPALKYLSRYLYRGVLSPGSITDYDPIRAEVTLRYTEGATGLTKHRTLVLADFLWQLLAHVLPSGFRRVRDYGLLHANATTRRMLLQIVLDVSAPPPAVRTPSPFRCPHCQIDMRLIAFTQPTANELPDVVGVAA